MLNSHRALPRCRTSGRVAIRVELVTACVTVAALAILWLCFTADEDRTLAPAIRVGAMRKPHGGMPASAPRRTMENTSGAAVSPRDHALPARARATGDARDADFLAALRHTDPDRRRLALRGLAGQLAAEADTVRASDFIAALLSLRDRAAESDAYAFTKVFADRLAASDPQVAARWTQSIPDPLQDVAYGLVARHWAARDPRALSEWARTIENPALRATLIRATAQQLRLADPTGFAPEWASALARTADGERFSDLIVPHWAKTNFRAAAEWSAALPDAGARDSALLALATTLGERDPHGALAWAAQFPEDGLRTRMIDETLSTWAARDPSAAAGWLEGQRSMPGLADIAVPRIAAAWLQKDPHAAARWLERAPVNPETKKYLLTLSAPLRGGAR